MWCKSILSHPLFNKILSSFYPSTCPVCNRKSDFYKLAPFCLDCWSKIKRYDGPSCKVCALPLSSEYADICSGCLTNPPPYSRVISYGLYKDTFAEAINKYKFHSYKRLADNLVELLLELDLPKMDGIIPVPISKKTLWERGFNQSLLIAKKLSERLKIPLHIEKLVKTTHTLPQVGLTKKERLSNLKNAFSVKGNLDKLRLFLVDDVMTTGTTVTECSKELIKAGAKEIIVIVLARAGEP
jgi:ComF family protein